MYCGGLNIRATNTTGPHSNFSRTPLFLQHHDCFSFNNAIAEARIPFILLFGPTTTMHYPRVYSLLSAIFLISICCSPEAIAQFSEANDPPGLFLQLGQDEKGKKAKPPIHQRAESAAVNFEQLGTPDNPADIVTLNLFDDVRFRAVLRRASRPAPGSFAWVGDLDGTPFGQVMLIERQGMLAGTVSTPGAVYQIQPGKDGQHEIRQLDHSAYPPELEPLQTPLSKVEPSLIQQGNALESCADIRVLVAWSPEAEAAVGGKIQMEALVALAIVETNTSYENSGLNQRIQLAHGMQTNPGDALNDFGADLNALSNLGDGRFDNVDHARNVYAADAVALLIQNGGSCGLGYVGSSAQYAFTVTHQSCATGYFSFGHELGHNVGAHHDWFVNDGTTGVEAPYNKGFVYVEDRWRTIMAYNTLCASSAPGNGCTRLPYWSNPEENYGGSIPMGVASDGPADCVESQFEPDPSSCAADNRLAQNSRCDAFANFREGAPAEGDRLQVDSSGIYGVSISSSTGHGGLTNYSYPLTPGTQVELDAPATSGGASFVDWSGCTSSSGTSCSVTISGDVSVVANYQLVQYDLQVNSTGLDGVGIESTTGHGGVTNYDLLLPDNTSVQLVAPGVQDDLFFNGWTGCTMSTGRVCDITLSQNIAVSVDYQPATCPAGTEQQTLFEDDMENGPSAWLHDSAIGPDTWVLGDNDASSPINSWLAIDVAEISDQRLTTPSIPIKPGTVKLLTRFSHRYDIEWTVTEGNVACFDAGVLDYSADGGISWNPVQPAQLLTGSYDGPVITGFGNPLDSGPGWCGSRGWSQVAVDLDGLNLTALQLRFRLGTDSSQGAEGWRVDDVRVKACVPPLVGEDPLFSDGFETIP